jgi:alpha-maltose-1-phosphate synthase
LRVLHGAYWHASACLGLVNDMVNRHELMVITSVSGAKHIVDRGYKDMFDPRIALRIEAGMSRKAVMGYPQRVIGLVKGIHGFHPDVLHVQEHADLFLNRLLLHVNRVPLVLTVHDPEPHLGVGDVYMRYYRTREHKVRQLRAHADWIIVHGDEVKEQLMRAQPELDPGRITPILHGPMDFMLRWVRPEYKEIPGTVLLFGVIRGQKGLGVLLDAWEKVRVSCPNARLVVAGTGADLPNHRDRCLAEPTVTLMDWRIPVEDASRLFAEASVVALPYREATQSGPLSIAVAFGKPVVVTTVGGLPEMVDENVSGLIVPPNDPEAFAKALIRLLNDDDLRQAMGEGARQLASTRLSWRHLAERTEDVYRQAIEFHKRRTRK